MVSETQHAQRQAGGGRHTARAAAVGLGVLGALVAWGIAELLGFHVRQPAFTIGAPAPAMTAGFVLVASAVGGLIAWLVLALMEHVLRRPRRAWLVIATLGLVVSLGGPLSGYGVDAADRVVLMSMHLVVGLIVIILLSRTLPSAAGRADSQGDVQ